jgi:predicted phosphodiesterase
MVIGNNSLRSRLDLDQFIADHMRGLSYSQLAEHHGITRGAVAGIIRDIKAGRLRPSSYGATRSHGDHPMPTYVVGMEPDNGGIPVYTGELHLDGNFSVWSDLHLPFTDFRMIERAIKVAYFSETPYLILAGDTLDAQALSSFADVVPPQDFDKELELLDQLLTRLSFFEAIYIMPGNHERRLMKTAGGQLDFGRFGRIFGNDAVREKLVITPYDRIFLTSGNQDWLVAHQANTSVYNGKVAEQLAWKYLRNVVVTHQHNSAGQMLDRYGNWVLMDVGGLHNPQMMAYKGLSTDIGAVHDQGFCTIIDGTGTFYSGDDRLTRWRAVDSLELET